MNLVLDTSAYSALLRGNKTVLKILNSSDLVFLPIIVIGELKAGFANGTRQQKNLDLLTQFMSDSSVIITNISDITTDIFAIIFTELRAKGRPISQNDLWIAAMAIELKLPLLTLDQGFKNIDRLKLIELTS